MFAKENPGSTPGISSGQGRDETTKSSDFSIKTPAISLPEGGGGILFHKEAYDPEIAVINRIHNGDEWCLPKDKHDNADQGFLERNVLSEPMEDKVCCTEVISLNMVS